MKGYRKISAIVIMAIGFLLNVLPQVGVDLGTADPASIMAVLQGLVDSIGSVIAVGLMIWSSKSPAPAKVLGP